MENHSVKRARLSTSVSLERGDTSGVLDRERVDDYRPQCTASKDQFCQINNYLWSCNKLLFNIGVEIREQRGGSLSLVSTEMMALNLTPASSTDSYRATLFLVWLLKTHICITDFKLTNDSINSLIMLVLLELGESFPLKKLTLRFTGNDATHADLMTVLPRLRSLEELRCDGISRSSDPIMDAVSVLLRTTTCLTSLAFYTCVDGKRVTLRLMARNRENVPSAAHAPTPPPSCYGEVESDGALAAFSAACALAEDKEEFWNARKTKFFITPYSAIKDSYPGSDIAVVQLLPAAPTSLKHLKTHQSKLSSTRHRKWRARQRQKGSARTCNICCTKLLLIWHLSYHRQQAHRQGIRESCPKSSADPRARRGGGHRHCRCRQGAPKASEERRRAARLHVTSRSGQGMREVRAPC
ncbi:hypothetical protein HPB51_010988 [Rhipicephalus microplus]|uniref:Uncharacterized protein n=1 Tax=Rhipicephalus microplus TaxID=6941 RepID=A0A9J6ETE6_RHIMP|nr:hypothetical protein HPB51_010988 [Rhipicephalus microplus]